MKRRREIGDGLRRRERNAKRLQKLGRQYRRSVPKAERTYTRWAEFLSGNAPDLLGLGAAEKYKAAPRG